jgi:hypothetical protein
MGPILPSEFVSALARAARAVRPHRACIFGSATTEGTGARDLDLLVVSMQFDGVLWQHRRQLLALPPGARYDLWLYTPEEFVRLYPQEHAFRACLVKTGLDLLEVRY